MKNSIVLIILFLAVIIQSCNDADKNGEFVSEGKMPVYSNQAQWTDVSVTNPQPANTIGKISVYNNYVYMVDIGRGIHVLNNSNPSSPAKVSFISIPLCTDIAIKNNRLFANNGVDMVVMNIANPAQPQVIKKVENVYSNSNEQSPPGYSGYFECVDNSKGRVIGWIDTILQTPQCRK